MADNNIRLDEFLRLKIPESLGKEISNSKIRRLIVAGAVDVNKSQCRIPGFNLRRGARVKIRLDEDKLFFEKQPDDIAFEVTEKNVLFEDENIIVINKPSHFPSEAGMVGSRDNLHAAVIRYLHSKNTSLRNPPYVGVIHRLDRDTSGVILFTKSRSVNAACHDMFEQHTARKIYHALVCGDSKNKKLQENDFTVEMFMGRISGKSQAAKWGSLPESKGGLYSKTDFTVLKEIELEGKKYFLIEARLYTGRTHQIRVHLSSMGLPILGDQLYGGKAYNRIMLHACSLTFPHPITGKEMTVSCPFTEVE
ncbi:RluA family pseudouridine synthase [Treponema sp.]|uniref:RluA family pseudouridine synthase n=1 Tax=Treponema sp. TaxID=166 RepID=UPI0025E9CCEC|nr:RluA family pseudouridine synthase [Treponema sp.]